MTRILILFCLFGLSAHANLRDRLRGTVEKRIEKKTESTTSYGYQTFSLQHDGRERVTRVYVPENLSPTGHYPLVINLHGGMGWAEQQADLSKMNEVADQSDFIVAYPNGTGKLKNRLLTFNAGACCGYARDRKVDDVGFIKALIEKLPSKFPVDPKRVYVTGMSNGAMLAHRLAAEIPSLIAAIGPVAGGRESDGPTPAVPVPVIHFHGLRDENARFEGGQGKNQFDPVPHHSIASTIEFWVKANHCEPKPWVVKGKSAITESYSTPTGVTGAPVVLVKFPDGGHTWPGGGELPAKLGPLVKDFSASERMWEFFKNHHR